MNNEKALGFWNELAETANDPACVKLAKKSDYSEMDAEFILRYANQCSHILDVGSGTGLIINKYYNKVASIVALERFKEFSDFIVRTSKIEIVNDDVIKFKTERKFDLVVMFGIMNYFNEKEAVEIYRKYYDFLKEDGKLIIKNQFGINEDVTVDGYSEEQKTQYFSEYRHIKKEVRILKNMRYENIEVIDIYPAECNRWDNTHFYAIVAEK